MSDTKKGYILILAAVACFSISYFSIDAVFRMDLGITPLSAIFWGFLGAVIVGSPYFLGRKSQREVLKYEMQVHGKLMLQVGGLMIVGAFLWFVAMSQSDSGMISLLFHSQVILAVLLGVLFLKERLAFKEIIAILISVLGLIFTASLKEEIAVKTVFIIMGSTLFFAFSSFVLKAKGQKINSKAFAFLRLTFMSFCLGVILFLIEGGIAVPPVIPLLLLGGSQVFGALLGRALSFEAHKYLPISKLHLVTLIESPLILFGAYILFGDTVSLQKFTGTLLILGGLLFFFYVQFKQTRK